MREADVMDGLIALPWRLYPAVVLMVGGAALVVRAAWREAPALALPVTSPAKGAALVRTFRTSVAGLGIAAVGAAWVWQIGWLFLLAVCIAGEELLETTVVMAAIKAGEPGWQRPALRLAGR